MAPVVCVAVSQPLGRSTLNIGSRAPELVALGVQIRTLETGCGITVHFVDGTTAEVGLNNYVYTLKKL